MAEHGGAGFNRSTFLLFLPLTVVGAATSSMTGAIVGAVVAAVVVLVLVAFLVTWKVVLPRRRGGKKYRTPEDAANPQGITLPLIDRTPRPDLGMLMAASAKREADGQKKQPGKKQNKSGEEDILREIMEAEMSDSMTVEQLRQMMTDPNFESTLRTEFEHLPSGQTGVSTVGAKPAYANKNRFRNVVPFDHNRVVLRQLSTDPKSHYINASYYNAGERCIIAAQGPLIETLVEFWRMLIQQQVRAVVNLTLLNDGEKTACACYWPYEGTTEQYGSVTVSTTRAKERGHFCELYLSYIDDERGSSGELVLLHYKRWPDKSVPEAAPLLFFRERLRKLISPKDVVVVHCSAGVGRTGTFIALDTLLDDAKATGKVDVLHSVYRLRMTRPNMVQTTSQYLFLHRCLLEGLLSGDTLVPVDRLHSVIASGVLEKEFQLVQQLPSGNKESPVELVGFTASPVLLVVPTSNLSLLPPDEKFAALVLMDSEAGAAVPSLQLLDWTGDVPTSMDAVMELLSKLDDLMKQSLGRVLLCCSDGATRCGLMAAIILLWAQRREEDAVDVFRIVRILRGSRKDMITSQKQYDFLYETVAAMADSVASRPANRSPYQILI